MARLIVKPDMVFFKVLIKRAGVFRDITSLIGPYVSSINVEDFLNKPSKLEIQFNSKNYIEDIFITEAKIKVKIGFDPFTMADVFEGVVVEYPEGSAKELLSYTVKAISEAYLTNITHTRSFASTPIKASIVSFLAAQNNLIPIIDIADKNVIPARYLPVQRNKTDYEFLNECARRWGCQFWVTLPNYLFFVDDNKVSEYYQRAVNIRGLSPINRGVEYLLSYRSDVPGTVPDENYYLPNVESVTWKYIPPQGGTPGNPGVVGSNENGRTTRARDYEIIWRGRTYRLREPYLSEARSNPSKFWEYASIVGEIGGAEGLRRFYVEVTHNSPTNSHNYQQSGEAYGFELDITLNEGDPYLKPPRQAIFYCGSLNPRADSSMLPRWLFPNGEPPMTLRIYETRLTYSNGELKSTLKCSIENFQVQRRIVPRPRVGSRRVRTAL